MRRQPPRSTRTDTLFPYTTLVRSGHAAHRVAQAAADLGDDMGLVVVRDGLNDRAGARGRRSEEHSSELQSLMRISYAVFCLNNNSIISFRVLARSHIFLVDTLESNPQTSSLIK